MHGFVRSLQCTLRVIRFGLMSAGQPCNSFCWVSSSSHGRSDWNDFMGYTELDWIKLCNIIAVRCAICLMVAFSRRVFFLIENPRQSQLPNFPYFDYLINIAEALDKHALGYALPKMTTWWLDSILGSNMLDRKAYIL